MSDISKFQILIKNQDFGGIEFARDEVRDDPELVAALVDEYWRIGTWKERSLMIQLIQDHREPVLREMMEDFLQAPIPDDAWADHMELTKAIALCHLEDDSDGSLFRIYLDDRTRLHTDIMLAEIDSEIVETPEVKSVGS